jgi:hypothetical protein
MPIYRAIGESNFWPLFAPPAQQFSGCAKDSQHFWKRLYQHKSMPLAVFYSTPFYVLDRAISESEHEDTICIMCEPLD